MDYRKIYDDLIANAIMQKRQKMVGYERHHILPRSLGGNNDPSNLVYLTTREHYIAHKLLVKIYVNDTPSLLKMIYALWWMSTSRFSDFNITNSSKYAFVKSEYSRCHPQRLEETKKRVKENRAAGLYKYDNAKAGRNLSTSLKKKSKEEMQARMKNSALTCDQKKRAESIRKGKSSQLCLTTLDGQLINFWSYDDVKAITGYTYNQVKYRVKAHNGVLPNGSQVAYISTYNNGHSKKAKSLLCYEKNDGEKVIFSPTDDLEIVIGLTYYQMRMCLLRNNGIMPDGSKIYWVTKYNHRGTNGRNDHSC